MALRNERRLLYMLGLTCLLFWVVDALSVMRLPWDTLALRGGWGVLTAGLGWLLARVPRQRRVVLRGVAMLGLPNLFLGLVVSRLGGPSNPIFAWFCVLPMVSLASRGEMGLGLLSTLLTLVAAGGVLWVHETPGPLALTWLLLCLGSGAVGLQSRLYYQRQREARLRAEARQRAAQEALVEAQARVLQAERLAQVGRLAAGVAHEVNNPLAFIQANLRFLLEELRQPTPGGAPAEYAETLRETQQGVERIGQIVRDLTALSRAEEVMAEVGQCELAPIIDTSVRMASVRLKSLVALAVEVAPVAPVVVRAEPRRLGQVLLNLLLNAADAIEEARVGEGRVALRVEGEGERVRLVVEDNGPGIRPENLGQLFTPFFTTKAPGKGTGLGLALSRQYVEAFGGQLRAENRPEGGARFVVELAAG